MALQAAATEDRPHYGILLMLLAWFCFALVDTGAKWLALLGLPTFQLAFMRYAVHFVLALGDVARGGLSLSRFQTPYLWALLGRSSLLVSATVLNFYVLQTLPLTVTSAIMFSSPIIVCVLSWPLLGVRIGPWRTGAVFLGFIGVLVVIRPFGEAFHWTMLVVVYNATALALYSIFTRKLAGVVATETMQVYMGGLGTFALLPFALWSWQSPDSLTDTFVLISLGVFGWFGHQMLTTAHRFASSGTLMPYTYSFIIYLSVLSYLIFAHVPDQMTLIGAAIIMLSGLIIWKREHT